MLLNRGKAYKDKDKWRETCRKQNRRYYGKTAFAVNGKKKWSEYEDKIVFEHIISDAEISSLLGRSVRAIQIRRTRLNKNITNNC